MMAEDWFEQLAQLRRDLSRRDRCAGCARSASRPGVVCRSASASISTSTFGRCGCSRVWCRRSANRRRSDIDMICVRENSEGEYAGVGGRIHVGTPHEVAQQTGIFTRARHRARAALCASSWRPPRPRKMLASATKSNALTYSMVLWDEVAEDRAQGLSGRRLPQVSRRRARGADDHAPADARRHRRVQSLRRHPHRHRIGDLGQPGHRAWRAISIRRGHPRPCSSRSTAPRPTSRARASPTRSARSGPAR